MVSQHPKISPMKKILFSLIISLLGISSYAQNLPESKEGFDALMNEYKELQMLYEMQDYCKSINTLSLKWVYLKTDEDSKKALLKKLQQGRTWRLNDAYWRAGFHELFPALMKHIDTLESGSREVMEMLPNFEAYEDATVFFIAMDIMESKINPSDAAIGKTCDLMIHFQLSKVKLMTMKYKLSTE